MLDCFLFPVSDCFSSHLKDLDDQQYNEDLKLGVRPTEGTRVSDHSVTAVCVCGPSSLCIFTYSLC